MNSALLPAGSTLWLLAHELKLRLRAMTGRRGGMVTVLIVLASAVLALAFVGVPTALLVRRLPIHDTPVVALILDGALLAIFTLILSQTLASATMALYERGDLDLLLSSPLPAGRVLTARAVSIAAIPFLWFAAALSVFALPLAVLGQPRWLTSYLVLASAALLASAAGLGIAMGLFKLIGPRATRTVGQLLAAVIGASFFLISQARNFLPNGAMMFKGVQQWVSSGAFASGSPLSWPARAVLGEPLPLCLSVGVSITVFTLVTMSLGRRFSSDASVAAGVGSGPARKAGRATSARGFGDGVFGAMVRKELRLLVRDPTLLSQVLLRTLYVLPLTFVLVRDAGPSGAGLSGLTGAVRMASLAGAVTFMAGQVAGSLAWITISAEDAPELLACAPVDGGLVRRAKLLATMVPVAILLALPLIALLILRPWIGLCAIIGASASAASAGLINLWFEKAAPRKSFRNRRGGSVIGAIAEMVIGLGWGIATGLAAALSLWAAIPTVVTLIALGVLYKLADPKRAY